MASTTAQMQINPPGLFTTGAVLVVCAYGLLLIIPVLISMMVVSTLQLGLWTFLIPLATICIATYFLPFGFGNNHVTRLVRSLGPTEVSEQKGFAAQLTLNPRLRSGLRALVEDADDIGWLTVTESDLKFRGDSIGLSVPRERIQELRIQSIGLRGVFVYPCVVVVVSGLPETTELRFADRSSWALPGARAQTWELYRRLTEKR